MAWEYSQKTGVLTHNSVFFAQGYSGKDSGTNKGKNNPALESIVGIGPIPRGTYTITAHTNSKGPWTIWLEPTVATDTFGRTNFRIHGDNKATMGSSSEGCIIINGKQLRMSIVTSIDKELKVTE